VKPENFLFTSNGVMKLGDFGIAKLLDDTVAGHTLSGQIIGTPAYMSPEQAEGKPADHRSDIYAFGLMLYEMYTGVQAFTGETPVSVALKQIRERPEPPRKLDPGLPKHVEQTILRCLEKDPAKRFQSVDEVVVALGGMAPTGTRLLLPPRQSSRTRMWIGIAAAVLVLAGAAAWLIWWQGHASDTLTLQMERFTLANGLPVVMSVDHATPTLTLGVAYKTGARSDPMGREGLSHLVAHLMFQGSANVAAGEHVSLIQRVGGGPSDSNYVDSDIFTDTLPSNQLELALYLEADRMRGLEITQAGLEEARNTLVEEQRTRIDNSPYGVPSVVLHSMAYDNPVNRRVGYGDPVYLGTITTDEANRFHQMYYTPSNAALSLVGDFDPAKAKERIRYYFESIPARTAPPPPDAKGPGRKDEARREVRSRLAQAPLLMLAWRVPPPSDPDWFVLFTLCHLLGGNDAARLQSALVKGSGVATAVQVLQEDNSGANLLMINLVASPGKEMAQIESRTYQEIERIGREGVPAAELERVFTEMARIRAMSLITTINRGFSMAKLLAVHGHPEGLNEWDTKARAVTSDRLKSAVAKYFTPANRTVLYVHPGGGQ
jgi:zinc protease